MSSAEGADGSGSGSGVTRRTGAGPGVGQPIPCVVRGSPVLFSGHPRARLTNPLTSRVFRAGIPAQHVRPQYSRLSSAGPVHPHRVDERAIPRPRGPPAPVRTRPVRPPRTRPSSPASGPLRRTTAGTSRPVCPAAPPRAKSTTSYDAGADPRPGHGRPRVVEAELLDRLLEEGGAPEQRLDERDLEIRANDREHDPGQAGAGADVGDRRRPPGSTARGRAQFSRCRSHSRGTSRGPIRPRRVPSVASSSA